MHLHGMGGRPSAERLHLHFVTKRSRIQNGVKGEPKNHVDCGNAEPGRQNERQGEGENISLKKPIEPLAFLIGSHFEKYVFTYHSYTLFFTNRLTLSLDSTSSSADRSLHTIVSQ